MQNAECEMQNAATEIAGLGACGGGWFTRPLP
jgi:hypothetical protein